jgi:hypothetical protein
VLDFALCAGAAVSSRQNGAVSENVSISLEEVFVSYDGMDLPNFSKKHIQNFPSECQHTREDQRFLNSVIQ